MMYHSFTKTLIRTTVFNIKIDITDYCAFHYLSFVLWIKY